MSHEAVAWARRQKVGGISTKAVLRELADRADRDTWKCFPSIATIADDIEASERVVKDALQRLEDLGLLRRARRYSGYQKRLSDEYELIRDAEVQVERTPGKPRGKTAASQATAGAVSAPTATPTVSSGANSAPLAPASRADSAPATSGPVGPEISRHAPSRADSALTAEAVDNYTRLGSLQVQNQQTVDAKSAPAFKEEPPLRTSNFSSSLHNATTERHPAPSAQFGQAAAGTPSLVSDRDDDDQEFSVEDVVLSGIDPRLNRALILQRLHQRGVNTIGLSLTAAVTEVYGRVAEGPKGITDANAFVVGCIVKSPDTWRVLGPRTSICDREGHRFQRAYPVCIRECGAENPNWRDERDEDFALARSEETIR